MMVNSHGLICGLIPPRKMKALILKKMIANGKTLTPGEVVSVEGWKHLKSLEGNRYIKMMIEESKPKATEVKPKTKAKKEVVTEEE